MEISFNCLMLCFRWSACSSVGQSIRLHGDEISKIIFRKPKKLYIKLATAIQTTNFVREHKIRVMDINGKLVNIGSAMIAILKG